MGQGFGQIIGKANGQTNGQAIVQVWTHDDLRLSATSRRRLCGWPLSVCSGRRLSRAFTLVEMLMAIVLLGVVAIAMTSTLTTVTRGTQDATELRSVVYDHIRVGARIDTALRESKQVLASDDQRILVWWQDVDTDGLPSLSELELIARDDSENTIVSITADNDAIEDVVYATDQDFDVVMDALEVNEDADQQVWGVDASSLSFSIFNSASTQSTLVSYRLTLSPTDVEQTVIGAVCFRNGDV